MPWRPPATCTCLEFGKAINGGFIIEQFFLKLRTADKGVPGTMPCLKDADFLLACLHDDLRHEMFVLVALEQWLNAVGLRADAVRIVKSGE